MRRDKLVAICRYSLRDRQVSKYRKTRDGTER